ncbi:platelet glycoprotein V-like [Bradysia coprophila]|uniref:platelet glycoprotein V-like n=1 Tax=Bradysia coprophila TaxID=38358 RepID=UPI00187D9851|nr:platelet glycoprotein V-like [Bradysia coprophila]
MRNSKLLTTLVIVGIVTRLQIISAQNVTVDGLCIYYYDSNSYTCDLHNVIINSPDQVLVINGDHLPDHSDFDVETLIHRNVSISYFNGEVLRKFRNLKYLAMGGVSHINENAFDVCDNLDRIYIGFNPLETFPPRMLQNCWNLRQFDASFNVYLTSIPEEIFGSTSNLEIFEVISTSGLFGALPPNLLRNMTNLKEFIFRSNYIANVDRDLLANAVRLEKVDLSQNSISDSFVITNLLNGHGSLKSIRVLRNRFRSFDLAFFAQFTELNDLQIGSDGQIDVDFIGWNDLPSSLTSIYFSNIGHDIPGDAFSHLTNLESLGFTGQRITNLHEDTFKQLVNLNDLGIQSTGIRSIPSNVFVDQTNLTQLFLSYNAIEELPEGVFASLTNIGFNRTALRGDLILSGNRIQRLNANSFGHHPYLQNIDLQFNEISEIEREIFDHFPNTMETVNLLWNNCTNTFFSYSSNLQNDERLQNCFNNWAGITTTEAPGSASSIVDGFVFSITFAVSTMFLMLKGQ